MALTGNDNVSIEVPDVSTAHVLVAFLVNRSAAFDFEPYPDGVYCFTVRPHCEGMARAMLRSLGVT